MKTILHLIPTLEGGGAERQLAMLAAEQASRETNVHIGLRRRGVHEAICITSGVKIHSLGDRAGLDPRLLLGMQRLMREIKPDIVQTWLPQADILGGIAATKERIPWVMTERSTGVGYSGEAILNAIRLMVAKRASAVVSNSEGAAQYWRKVLRERERIYRVPNAVDVERVQRICARGEGWEPDASSGYRFIVAGRLTRSKGIATVVQAMDLLPIAHEVQLIIIGEGPFRGRLHAQIQASRSSHRIKMLPYDPEWWRFMGTACGLISMSEIEGQPNVVLEAIAAKCPVIVSGIPAHREILASDSAIFVPLRSALSLANAMASVLADYSAALGRAESAFKRVSEWKAEAIADAYMNIYRRSQRNETIA